MIALASVDYDPLGYVDFLSVLDIDIDARRRVSATATLDGGVSIYDNGFAASDTPKVLTIRNPTQDQIERATRLLEVHAAVRLFRRSDVLACVLTNAVYARSGTPTLNLTLQLTE